MKKRRNAGVSSVCFFRLTGEQSVWDFLKYPSSLFKRNNRGRFCSQIEVMFLFFSTSLPTLMPGEVGTAEEIAQSGKRRMHLKAECVHTHTCSHALHTATDKHTLSGIQLKNVWS